MIERIPLTRALRKWWAFAELYDSRTSDDRRAELVAWINGPDDHPTPVGMPQVPTPPVETSPESSP